MFQDDDAGFIPLRDNWWWVGVFRSATCTLITRASFAAHWLLMCTGRCIRLSVALHITAKVSARPRVAPGYFIRSHRGCKERAPPACAVPAAASLAALRTPLVFSRTCMSINLVPQSPVASALAVAGIPQLCRMRHAALGAAQARCISTSLCLHKRISKATRKVSRPRLAHSY